MDEQLRAVPGMTTERERECLREAAAMAQGRGQLVDLGSFMGSLTLGLGLGLAQSPASADPSIRIHAYDRFVWESWMTDWWIANGRENSYDDGESFLPEFNRQVAPCLDRVVVYAGDLCDYPWTGGPIEILSVDAMKDWHTTKHIATEYFPALVPGGLYFQQDFAHFYTSWIHLIHYRLRDFWELVEDVEWSAGVLFRLTKPMSRDFVASQFPLESATPDEVDAAFRYTASLVSEQKRGPVLAAHAMHYLHTGGLQRAFALAEELSISAYRDNGDVVAVIQEVKRQL
jgi:hypothetical protein